MLESRNIYKLSFLLSTMVTKQDWEKALTNQQHDYDSMSLSYSMQKPQMEHMLKFIKSKIAEFPDEDPMPKEVKELVKDVKGS